MKARRLLLEGPAPARAAPHQPLALKDEAARNRLLARLQAGASWLREVNERLCQEEHIWNALRQRFAENLHEWDAMDRMVRELYGWEECVFGMGNRCPPDAVVRCAFCGRRGS